jgi:hypothetical protein
MVSGERGEDEVEMEMLLYRQDIQEGLEGGKGSCIFKDNAVEELTIENGCRSMTCMRVERKDVDVGLK